MNDPANVCIQELRQILQEILSEAETQTHNKLVIYTFHGWQAAQWIDDMTVHNVQVHKGQTVIGTITHTMCNIQVKFELSNKHVTANMTAPNINSKYDIILAEPNSLVNMAKWLKDAMEFAIRETFFPINSV